MIKNGQSYPGKHNTPTERTSSSQKPLEAQSQTLIIWKSLISYVRENLAAGKSINIKRFGAFTFDIATDPPKIAMKSGNQPNLDLHEQRLDRKNVHHCRPCFVVDQALQMHLTRYLGKEEITPAKSQHSIFQKGFRMVYCNPVPIAQGCLMGKDVVQDALDAIFLAVIDLVKFGKNIDLAFGFCNIRIINGNLKIVWCPNFVSSVKSRQFENTMKRSTTPVSSIWKSDYHKSFASTTLGSLIKKPNHEVVATLNQKTMALKIMSLDMSSSAKFVSGGIGMRGVGPRGVKPREAVERARSIGADGRSQGSWRH